MSRRLRVGVLVAWCGANLLGCSQPKNRHYLGDADLQYYTEQATAVEYPNVATMTNDAALYSQKPPTVRDPSDKEIWELTLAEALNLAIANTKVIRSRGAFKTPGNPLLNNPDRVNSSYDPSIQDMSTNFFQRGTESALSAFDTTFNLQMDLMRTQMVQNNILLGGGVGGGDTLQSDIARYQSNVQKTMPNGDTFKVSNNWNYLATNQPLQLFPGYYQAYLQAQYRHPLLAGAGTEYTRIAGPVNRLIPQLTVVDQGVLIARINTDITIADFELNVTNLIKDVEDQYWELYLAYRTYDAELKARTAAHNFWQTTKRRADAGARKGSVVDEGQARENYFTTRGRVENAITGLYTAEAQLRRMLGLPVNDGRFIRPKDEPLATEYVSDWTYALTESLSRRVELRRQKWQIKSLELQLRAAESLVRPRLDFVGSYQQNGFGQHLFGDNDANSRNKAAQYQGAYDTLFQGNQSSWDVGFEFSMPFGFRQAMALKRNLELRLTKARAVLATQELEISHELGNTFSLIDSWYQSAETAFDRHIAAQRQLEVVEREYEAGKIPVDLLLRSQANVAAAETQYYLALTRYNQAITDLRLRKGSLLEENNIHLAEGAWTQDARVEALRRAWARSFAFENPLLKDSTEPLAVPAEWQAPGYAPLGEPLPYEPTSPAVPPEEIPLMPVPSETEPEEEPAISAESPKLPGVRQE